MTQGLARCGLFRQLAPSTLRALETLVVERDFAAGDLLLRGGGHARWLHVIERGLVREYYVTAEGDEHTRVFIAEGGVTGSLLDLTSAAPSVTWIQALEATHTLALPWQAFNALAADHRDLESLARRNAEALAVRKTLREYEMLALSAAERLARWRTAHPELDGRITRRLLASYLGITPVHLSWISSRRAAGATAGGRGTAPRRR